MSSWLSRLRGDAPAPSTSPATARVQRGDDGPVEQFWRWWRAEGAATSAQAIDRGDPERLVPLLGSRVSAVHPSLSWELGPGAPTSEHVLTVTADGDPKLRAHARRWLRGAPTPDAVWSYSDSRLPSPSGDMSLRLGRTTLGAGDVVVSWSLDVRRDCFDVVVGHPAFAGLAGEARGEAALLFLDHALGEQVVETWIGGVTTAPSPLPHPERSSPPIAAGEQPPWVSGSGPLAALATAVGQLVDSNTEHGLPVWKLAHGSTARGAVWLAASQVPLRAASAPHLDEHLSVELPFRHRTEGGLPAQPSLVALRAFADQIEAALGDDGRLLAHETFEGRRLLHLYVDSTTTAADPVHPLALTWPEGKAVVRTTHDPAWHNLAHLNR